MGQIQREQRTENQTLEATNGAGMASNGKPLVLGIRDIAINSARVLASMSRLQHWDLKTALMFIAGRDNGRLCAAC